MPTFRSVTPLLKTLDMEATLRFYTQTLGFKVEVLWPESKPTFCVLERDAVSVSFVVDEHGRYPPQPCLTGQVYFELADVKGYHAQLLGKVEILWGLEVYFYQRREFAIHDNNGYILTFSEPTTDPPTCPAD